jgi:SET domain-containing protein
MSADRLAVRSAAGKGRGVFAVRAIAPGELLETAPAIALGAADTDALVGLTLDAYYFAHPEDAEGGLVALGLSTLVNHAESPNAETAFTRDEAGGWTVTLRALRRIGAGEEITRRYACALWFDPA